MNNTQIKHHQLIDKARLGDLQALEELIEKYKYIALKKANEYENDEQAFDKIMAEERKLVQVFIKEKTGYKLSEYLHHAFKHFYPYEKKRVIENINVKVKQGDKIAREELINISKKQIIVCADKIYNDIYNHYYNLEIQNRNKLCDWSYLDDNYEFKFPDYKLSKEDIIQDVTLKALELLEMFILKSDTYFSVFLANNLERYRNVYVKQLIKNNNFFECYSDNNYDDCGGIDENLEERIMVLSVLNKIKFTETQQEVVTMALNKESYASIIEKTKITKKWGVDSCLDLSAEKIRKKIFKKRD